jgi:hypothetical protein
MQQQQSKMTIVNSRGSLRCAKPKSIYFKCARKRGGGGRVRAPHFCVLKLKYKKMDADKAFLKNPDSVAQKILSCTKLKSHL